MKTLFLSAAICFLGINSASAQKIKETEVPKAVVSSFHSNFKNATAKEWEKEGNNYEAEFDWNKVETSASFSAEGKLMETEHEIKVSELPKAVSDYVTKNYAGSKIEEASKITTPDGVVTYEAEVKKGKEEMDLMFDSTGAFIKKEVETEKDKD